MVIQFHKYKDEQHGRNNERFVHLVDFSDGVLPSVIWHEYAQAVLYLVPLERESVEPNLFGVAPRLVSWGGVCTNPQIDSLNISGEAMDLGGLMVAQESWVGKKCYYRIVKNSGGIVESDVFLLKNIGNNLAHPQSCDSILELMWNDTSIINGIDYTDMEFTHTLFLNGFLENPDYIEKIESETDGLGQIIRVFTRIEKDYSVRAIIPQYIYDALIQIPMYRNCRLYDGRRDYDVTGLAIEKEMFFAENGFQYFVVNIKLTTKEFCG